MNARVVYCYARAMKVRTACDAPFTRGIINNSFRKKQLSRHLNFLRNNIIIFA